MTATQADGVFLSLAEFDYSTFEMIARIARDRAVMLENNPPVNGLTVEWSKLQAAELRKLADRLESAITEE